MDVTIRNQENNEITIYLASRDRWGEDMDKMDGAIDISYGIKFGNIRRQILMGNKDITLPRIKGWNKLAIFVK